MADPRQEDKSTQNIEDKARRTAEQATRTGQAAAETGDEVARAGAHLLQQNAETLQNAWRSGSGHGDGCNGSLYRRASSHARFFGKRSATGRSATGN